MDANEKSERLIESACAILNAAPQRRLNAVVLNKALFYFDLAALRDFGQVITHNTYIGIQQGPVVARYPDRLIKPLEDRGLAKQVSEWDGSKPIRLESNLAHFAFLTADACELATTIGAHFAGKTSAEASAFSHENPGWVLAWNEYRRTGKPVAVNMLVALQQIVEADPWMESPLLNDEQVLALADQGVGEDW